MIPALTSVGFIKTKKGGIMQRSIQIFILSILLSAISFAQGDKGYFKTGSKALLFEFSGLADLGAGSYNGGLGLESSGALILAVYF
jgi:hypothetical protein